MRIIQFELEDQWRELGWGAVGSLQFRSDGRELAAVLDVGGESRIAFWDLQRNVERRPVSAGGSDVESAIAPVLSADFGLVARLGYDAQQGVHAILSRLSRGKLSDRYLGWWWGLCVSAMRFSPDGRYLAVTGWDNDEDGFGEGVALWDVAAVLRAPASGPGQPRWVGRQAATLLPNDDAPSCSLAFSPDGRTLAVGSVARVRRWDLATGGELPALSLGQTQRYWVGRLSCSPDGKTLAATVNAALFFLDVETGAARAIPGAWIHDLAFHPGGRLLATVYLDRNVTFWDVASGKKQQAFTGDVEGLACVAFSPDGCTCAAGGAEGRVVQWDVEG
jgi:WD40 repeat protein